MTRYVEKYVIGDKINGTFQDSCLKHNIHEFFEVAVKNTDNCYKVLTIYSVI